MEDSAVHNFSIVSHKHIYNVEFDSSLVSSKRICGLGTHYVIDKNVASTLGDIFDADSVIQIDANESTKSYRGIEPIIEQLLDKNLRRDSHLVAIGGGITQDIVCFIANTYMRGVAWTFVPTTLLAQADSCIGSKSSINFGKYKNLLGSFTPPNNVIISNEFLKTLPDTDIRSGIGEILKLYIIDGKHIHTPWIKSHLQECLYDALQIKKQYIEIDEFDTGVRNILNYGHCFGHAIESASDFGVPHGIAVTIGMDIANKFALENRLIDTVKYQNLKEMLFNNYVGYTSLKIAKSDVHGALLRDKKNTGKKINLILPVENDIKKIGFDATDQFWSTVDRSIKSILVNYH